MKRTTYILIGVFISIAVVIIGSLLYLKVKGTKNVSFPIECKRMNLAGVRVVKIYTTQADVIGEKAIIAVGNLTATPALGTMTSTISYPDTKYLNATQIGDTLLLEIDFKLNELPKEVKNENHFVLSNVFLHLVADSTLTYISNDVQSLEVILKGMSLDSLTIRSNNPASANVVKLDSCAIRTFDLAGSNVLFKGNNSLIDDFYLDLDCTRSWTFDQCTVDTEHLTGSGSHYASAQKGECRKIRWIPKNEDANLSVTVAQKCSVSFED